MGWQLKGKSILFQVALGSALVGTAWGADAPEKGKPEVTPTAVQIVKPKESSQVIETIIPSGAIDETKSLRFGDPETMIEEQPTATPLPAPKKAVPTESSADPGQQVRTIIASVPPGSEYPDEFDKIIEIGKPAIPALLQIFSDAASPWQSRWIAAMALGRLGTSEAREALGKGLQDTLFLVRMASIQALAHSGDASFAPAVRNALSDRAMVVRSTAVDALRLLNDREAVPDLIKELASSRNFYRGKSFWIREQIVDALGNLGNEKTIPTLLAVLQENELTMRLHACSALAKISPDAEPATTEPMDEGCVVKWSKWGTERTSTSASPPAQP